MLDLPEWTKPDASHRSIAADILQKLVLKTPGSAALKLSRLFGFGPQPSPPSLSSGTFYASCVRVAGYRSRKRANQPISSYFSISVHRPLCKPSSSRNRLGTNFPFTIDFS